MSNLLTHLNPEQLAAVTLPPQHALILAGAGSGKTRVLTTRIAWLIQTGNVSPHGILAVTFTNKAAKEMLTRLSAMLPINTRGMWIGTFHGLCNRLLRAHHRDAGLPALFQILDSGDQQSTIKRILRAMNADEDKFPPRQVANFINSAKEEGERAKDVQAYDDMSRRYIEFYAAYEEQCQREGVVDFAELLLRSYELLTRNEILRDHYRNRFRHVLVDEFQDTNRLQYKWLQSLAGPSAAIFAVGDDDQSIYRFRGANVGNMADFERDYKVQNLIRLEQNYRSHGNILEAANALIQNNGNRLGKNLWTDAGSGEPIRVYEAQTDGYEAHWIVEEVQALVREGMARKEMAILYRSNAQSRIIEHALFSAGIPYRVYGGLRFFERMEVKHALAYLRLLANPDDDGAFLRIVNFPTRGIGARSIESLQDAAKANDCSLWRAATHVQGKSSQSLAAFIRLIDGMRDATRQLPLPEVIEHVLHASGLLAHYKNERDGADRVENLEELINAATNFLQEEAIDVPVNEESAPGEATEIDPLAAFLAHASLEAGENQALEGADALQMMTVHSAKGLEFNVVFITGLEEGLFPHEQSVNEIDGLEEERRLMYVAITRARQRLYLSFSQNRMLHGQTRYNIASRFFDEIPKELLKWLTPRLGRQMNESAWGAASPSPRLQAAKGATSSRSDLPFRIGQSVVHAKFGQGVVVSAEGSGSDAKLQINFGRHGMKWLALAYAKLEAA
ncbi:MAG TPA: UvrD-helicase domain-containing protein [Burkholderiales bacterium]|nr:UvrD-helicase domain-containing protein [Burkholderiales bacterium]